MNHDPTTRLSDCELNEFFRRIFPSGVAGADVVEEIAPEGWQDSPLFRCFHPTPDQVLTERVRRHRRMEEFRMNRRKTEKPTPASESEPTMEDVLAKWEEHPVNIVEEVTEIVCRCLWNVFSDNHDVIAADGRVVDIGSFRGASAFLDSFVADFQNCTSCDDEYRFYMGAIRISQRADLMPVYRMIFRRIKSLGADWNYHFPRLYLIELQPRRPSEEEQEGTYSPSEAFAQAGEERLRQAELDKSRAELNEIYSRARNEAMDRAAPESVRAYQEVYGRGPEGWPPAANE